MNDNLFADVIKSLQAMQGSIMSDIGESIESISQDIVSDMKSNLEKEDSIDTGDLINSCRQETKKDALQVESIIYADAKSDDGKYYADYLEHGTGEYKDNGTGRQGGWWYYYKGNKWKKDANGQYEPGEGWRFTYGGRPHPFIRPAYNGNLGKLDELQKRIVLHIEKGW